MATRLSIAALGRSLTNGATYRPPNGTGASSFAFKLEAIRKPNAEGRSPPHVAAANRFFAHKEHNAHTEQAGQCSDNAPHII